MALINGDDFASGDLDSFQQNNRMKNHWRVNNADLTNPSPGMIRSTPTTEKLSHYQAAAWEEIIQTNTPIGDDKQIIGGDNSDMILIPYEETLNDAIIWGLPVSPKRGLIFCDVADVAVNFTALITASAQPMVSIVDLDIDSYLSFGYAGDDLPDIWSNRTLNLQYEAIAGVNFFANSGAGENRYVYWYGWSTGRGARQYTRFQMSDTNDEFIIEAENNGDHEGITIALTEAGQRFRLRQNSDILSWYLDGTDAFMRWSDGQLELQTDETNATTVVRILPNGTSEVSQLDFYDADGIRLSLYTAADRGYIESIGGVLGINPNAAQNVDFFENAASGETPELLIYGFRAADALRSLEIGVGVDAADTASFDGVSNYRFDGNIIISDNGYIGSVTDPGAIQIEADGDVVMTQDLIIQHDQANAELLMRSYRTAASAAVLRFGKARNTLAAPAIVVAGDSLATFNFQGYDGAAWENVAAINVYCEGVIGAGQVPGNIRLRTANAAGVMTEAWRIDSSQNFGLNQTSFGTNAAMVYAQGNGTAPTTSPADCFQMWSADVLGVANKAGPHWRSQENGMYAWHGGAGTINSFTYQADVADDGIFTLPAITDSAWGFIQAGDNEEYAFFTIDDDGDVTLISNSANVVANVDTDGNLVLGTAGSQEPLQIRNRLGGVKNINLIIWYS